MSKQNTLHNFILWLSIFLLLFRSDMTASIVLGAVGRYILWGYGLVLLVFNRKMNRQHILLLSGFVLVRIIIMVLQGNSSSDFWRELFGFVLTMNTIFQLAERYTAREIAETYVKQLTIICVVSLVCFSVLTNASENYVLSISQLDGRYRHNYIYTWGWDTLLFERNAGPWWEPGGFQCFIVLALLMILSGNCDKMKKLRISFVILLATWVTTQSTTGYVIMVGVILLMYKQIIRIIFNRPAAEVEQWKKLFLFFIIVVLLLVFYLTLGMENINDKLVLEHASTKARINDVSSSFTISLINPILGVGDDYLSYYTAYGIGNNSASLLTIPMFHGWIYFILYLFFWFRGIYKFFKQKDILRIVGSCVVLVIISLTEGIIGLPVFLLFFAKFKEDNVKKQNVMLT